MTTEAYDCEPKPVLAGIVVLLDEAPLLEGGKQTRRGRLVQSEAACELGDSCFPLRFPQRNQKRRSAIDRPYRIPVEHFFS
jgi:hypothetical protein